jgi:hypothetical protein
MCQVVGRRAHDPDRGTVGSAQGSRGSCDLRRLEGEQRTANFIDSHHPFRTAENLGNLSTP